MSPELCSFGARRAREVADLASARVRGLQSQDGGGVGGGGASGSQDDPKGKGKGRDKGKDEFKGHPWGKRPDALMKMVLYRVSEALQNNEEAVKAAIAQGPDPEATVKAMKTILEWGGKVQEPETIFHATRCFVITTDDAEGNEVKKWIFAVCHHSELHQSFETLRDNGGGRAAGLQLERDSAPRSQAAKKVEKLAFHEGKGAKGKANAKKRQRK